MANALKNSNKEWDTQGSEGCADAIEISERAGVATESRWDFHGDKKNKNKQTNKTLP